MIIFEVCDCFHLVFFFIRFYFRFQYLLCEIWNNAPTNDMQINAKFVELGTRYNNNGKLFIIIIIIWNFDREAISQLHIAPLGMQFIHWYIHPAAHTFNFYLANGTRYE